MLKELIKFLFILLLSSNIVVSGIVISNSEATSRLQQAAEAVTPIISVDPENGTANVGENYTISVRVDNVTALYGFGIIFRWGAQVLKLVNLEVTVPVEKYPNGVLYQTAFIITNETDLTLGIYDISATSFAPAPTFNGSGTIFNMTFNVVGTGECYFYFQYTDLLDKNANSIYHETRDGYFYRAGVGKVPVADFTVTPDVLPDTPEPDVIANSSATFNASSSSPSGGITRYVWDFGDGNTTLTNNAVITHVFVVAPSYPTVELSVVDVDGSQSNATRLEISVVPPNPVAHFTFWPGTAPGLVPGTHTPLPGPAVINKTVQFNASDSYDPYPNGLVINYTWDFGDGSSVIVTNNTAVTHNYTSLTGVSIDGVGNYYLVKLTVYSVENLNSTEEKHKLYVVERRDVDVTSVTLSRNEFMQGEDVTINVSVANKGHTDEFFNLTTYYNVTATKWAPIGQLSVEAFPGQNTTLQDKSEPIELELSPLSSNSNPLNCRVFKFHGGPANSNNDTKVRVGDTVGNWTINPSKMNNATGSPNLATGFPLSTGGWALGESDGRPKILNGEFSPGNWAFMLKLYTTRDNVTATVWARVLKSTDPNPQASGANVTLLQGWTALFPPELLQTSAKPYSGTVPMPLATFVNEYLYFEFGLEVTENLSGNATTDVVFQLSGPPLTKPRIKPTAFTTHKQYTLHWNTEFTPAGKYVVKAASNEVPHETNITNNIALSGGITVNERPSGIPPLDIAMDVGKIHFTGEIAEFYILVSSQGKRVNASEITVFLLFNHTISQLNLTLVDPKAHEPVTTGVYLIQYPIPLNATPGTYMLVVDASRFIVEANFTQQGTGLEGFLISPTLSSWNATITEIKGDIATIVTGVSEIKMNLTAINATLSGLTTEAEGEILAKIDTALGQVTTDINNINATITNIEGNTVTINSTLGEVQDTAGGVQSTLTIGITALSILSAIAAIVAVLILLRVKKQGK